MLPMKKFGNKDVVNWKAITEGFEFVINETRCEVVSNENVTKVSKNGKTHKERRLTVRAIGSEATIEVSATSFKAMSFGKRLAKAMGKAPKAKAQRKEEDDLRTRLENEMYESGYKANLNRIEKLMDLDSLNNINEIDGSILYETANEYIDFCKRVANKFLNDEDSFAKGGRKCWEENKNRLEAHVHNNWEKLMKRTNEEWYKFREQRYGKGWEQSWKRQNEYTFDIEPTEFDGEFEKCSQMKEVKAIYRRLAKQYHPDMMGGDTEKMKELTKAYEKALRNVDRNEEPTIEQLLDELLAEVEAELKGAFLLA